MIATARAELRGGQSRRFVSGPSLTNGEWPAGQAGKTCYGLFLRPNSANMAAPNRRSFLQLLWCCVSYGLLLVILLGLTLWAAGALFFMLPFKEARGLSAAIYAIAVFGLLLRIRPLWKGAIAGAGLFLLVFAWTLTIRPSNDGHWEPDVAQTAWAEIDGDSVTIHNFRNFDYQTSTDFIPNWETKTVDLTALQGIDLFVNYWGVEWMAHPVVSFQFGDNDHVAFSIELRRQVGQAYSTLAGLYKTYGLIYLVGDERDLVRVRTNYRKEDIYLYRTVIKPTRARAIFLDYLRSLNALHEHPQFYNELTSNCTTNVRVHTAATAIGKPPPWDWRILINGYADQMLYERGDLVGQLAFADLKHQALINEKARTADHDLYFSRRIRDGVIGF
jgi:hypothetical protein